MYKASQFKGKVKLLIGEGIHISGKILMVEGLCLKFGIALGGIYLNTSNLHNSNVSSQERCYVKCGCLPPLAGHPIGTGGLGSNPSCV